MDETTVQTRLRRIEALERERAHPRAVLAEVRELLREAEAWIRVAPPDDAGADREREGMIAM